MIYYGEQPYKGFDLDLGRAVVVRGNDSVVVSAATAKRLLHDFGMLWEDQGEAPPPWTPVEVPPNVVDVDNLRR